MHVLPDGSSFFVGTFYSERPPGLVNWFKYTRSPCRARGWLLLWRNYRTAYTLSRTPDQGPPMSHWKSLRWSVSVHPYWPTSFWGT